MTSDGHGCRSEPCPPDREMIRPCVIVTKLKLVCNYKSGHMMQMSFEYYLDIVVKIHGLYGLLLPGQLSFWLDCLTRCQSKGLFGFYIESLMFGVLILCLCNIWVPS